MKKGWKIFWIICAVTACLGLILCIAGAAMGATLPAIRKAYGINLYRWNNEWRHADWFDEDQDEDYQGADTAGGMENAVPSQAKYVTEFKDIQSLDIEADYAELDIRKSKNNTVTVDTSGLNSRLREALFVGEKDKELKIESKNRNIWKLTGNKEAGRIVITVPQNVRYEKASFDIDAGLLKIEDISAGKLEINVGAGQSVVKRFSADELEADCGTGQMIFYGTVNKLADVSCDVGEIKLHLTGSQSDYDYSLKCDVGRLKIGNDSYSGLGNEQDIDNGADKKMDIECSIGNVAVTFDENK